MDNIYIQCSTGPETVAQCLYTEYGLEGSGAEFHQSHSQSHVRYFSSLTCFYPNLGLWQCHGPSKKAGITEMVHGLNPLHNYIFWCVHACVCVCACMHMHVFFGTETKLLQFLGLVNIRIIMMVSLVFSPVKIIVLN